MTCQMGWADVPFLEEPERALRAVVVDVRVPSLVGPEVRIAGKALVAGLAHVLQYKCNTNAPCTAARTAGIVAYVAGTQMQA